MPVVEFPDSRAAIPRQPDNILQERRRDCAGMVYSLHADSSANGGKMMSKKQYLKLLQSEVKPVKLGNTNKSGKCGMCGVKVGKLYPCKVGQVDFMVCENCKGVMDM